MPYPKKEIEKITQQVTEEFAELEGEFGFEVTDDEIRAITFAVASALEKSLPF